MSERCPVCDDITDHVPGDVACRRLAANRAEDDWRTRCLAAESAQAEAERKLAVLVGAVEVALSKADSLVTHLHNATDIENMGRAGEICRTLRAALPAKDQP